MKPTFHRTALFAALATLDFAHSGSASAHITRVEFDPAKRTVIEVPGGVAGAYERLVGIAYGELDPKDARNSLIQDIELAPRNARGLVEYETVITLTKPMDAAKSSGTLLYEVVNRSNELWRTWSYGADSGEQFMMRRGISILRSGWQGDIGWGEKGPAGGQAYALKVPVAKNPDGSAITGRVLTRIQNESGSTAATRVYNKPVPYLPATLNTADSSLTWRSSEKFLSSDVVNNIPSTDWSWADCTKVPFPGTPDPLKICLKDGFKNDLSYELVFTAKDPLVLGIGFAATRDLVSFFRYEDRDSTGKPNVLAKRIRHSIGFGLSQTGQYVRTFINLGFNVDEKGRMVWDGAMPHVAGRQLSLNLRFALPNGTATENVPDGQGTLWWGSWTDEPRGHASSSMLARCLTSKTCPKIIETFGSAEMWNIRMSPGLVGTNGKQDIPLPENVRRYYFPGQNHQTGRGGFSQAVEAEKSDYYKAACEYPANPNSQSPSMRAIFVALQEWLNGVEPPRSKYPTLADGTLVADTKAAVGFPDIPGVSMRDHQGRPQFDLDFGPGLKHDDVSGVLTKQPPDLKAVIPAFVARVDADGNEVSGVPSIIHQAPLGTYMGWNVTASGFYKGQLCFYAGSFIPFAKTEQERTAKKDPRPSLEARYKNHAGFVQVVRTAAERDVKARFLLKEDAEGLIRQAEESDILK
jgi:hypothetical protein